jgi:acyl transferase domain-containing protein
MSLPDALNLVAVRGRLMADTAPGRMVAVRLAESEARDLLTPGLDLAAVNGPRACVLSGTPKAVRTLIQHLDRDRVDHRDLGQTRAFHSSLMDGVLDEFERRVREVRLAAPAERVVSTVTGDWATAGQLTDPRYWRDQIRMPVRFGAAAVTAAGAGSFLLEAGPGTALVGHVRRSAFGDAVSAVSTMGGQAATETMRTLGALGEWWASGGLVDWPRIFGSAEARVHLPTYPFAGPVVAGPPEPPAPAASAAPPDASAVDRVTELLCRTLGVMPPADLELSYLGAGGESLTAIHVIGRLRSDFGYETPVALLLEPIPLRSLAERIVEEGAAASDDGLLASLLDEFEAEDARS